jgi:hypothetical protein
MPFADPAITREQGLPPFFGSWWDLPSVTPALRGTADSSVVFGDKATSAPLFQSQDQILLTNKCAGQLQFLQPLPEANLEFLSRPDGRTIDIQTPQRSWVVTHSPPIGKCSLGHNSNLEIGLQVGGKGPGSVEMLSHSGYQANGAHFLGTYEPGIGPGGLGVYCVKPAAVSVVGIRPGGGAVFQDAATTAAIGRKAFAAINITR